MFAKALCTLTLAYLSTTTAWSQKAGTPPAPLPQAASSSQPQGDNLVGSIQLVDKGKSAIQTYNVAMETSFSFSKRTGLDKFIGVLDENEKKLYFRADGKSLLMVAAASTILVDVPAGGRPEKGASAGERNLYIGDYYLYRATGKVEGDKIFLTSLEALGRKPAVKPEKAKK